MRIRYGRSRLSDIFAKWLRTYIVDECPEARKERIVQDAIDALKANIALLEAMRRWERENEARLCDERQTQAKPPSLLPRAAARQTT